MDQFPVCDINQWKNPDLVKLTFYSKSTGGTKNQTDIYRALKLSLYSFHYFVPCMYTLELYNNFAHTLYIICCCLFDPCCEQFIAHNNTPLTIIQEAGCHSTHSRKDPMDCVELPY